jgi:hypothetical protein
MDVLINNSAGFTRPTWLQRSTPYRVQIYDKVRREEGKDVAYDLAEFFIGLLGSA